jgi:hypothetical protein
VFFVLYAMCMLVFLNKFVMMRVSVPMYVNVANFCFCGVSGVYFPQEQGSPMSIVY